MLANKKVTKRGDTVKKESKTKRKESVSSDHHFSSSSHLSKKQKFTPPILKSKSGDCDLETQSLLKSLAKYKPKIVNSQPTVSIEAKKQYCEKLTLPEENDSDIKQSQNVSSKCEHLVDPQSSHNSFKEMSSGRDKINTENIVQSTFAEEQSVSSQSSVYSKNKVAMIKEYRCDRCGEEFAYFKRFANRMI